MRHRSDDDQLNADANPRAQKRHRVQQEITEGSLRSVSDQIKNIGLVLLGRGDRQRQDESEWSSDLRKAWKSFFGATVNVLTTVWRLLEMTEGFPEEGEQDIKCMLLACHFVKNYPLENTGRILMDVKANRTYRKCIHQWVDAILYLENEVVSMGFCLQFFLQLHNSYFLTLD